MRNTKAVISAIAWVGVLLLASHQSEHHDVLGMYSWDYAYFLALAAVFAGAVSVTNPSRIEKIYKARGSIILTLSSFLVAIVVAEVVFRALDPLGLSNYEHSTQYFLDMQRDSSLVYRQAPFLQKEYGNVSVTINDLGLRDRPILDKQLGEYRILALGDSVTFGWGVDQEKIFAARLGPLLSDRFGRPVRVINSGVGGYNTVQEVAYFKQSGLRLQPDLVMLTYVENDTEVHQGPYDPWGEISLKGKSFAATVRAALGKLWVYRFVDHAYRYGGRQNTGGIPVRDGGWSASMTALAELVSLCKEQRIPLLIFYFHWQPNSSQPLMDAVILQAKENLVIDIEPWFHGRDIYSLMNSKFDGHPNSEAHRLMAEHMAKEIANYVTPLAPSAHIGLQDSVVTLTR